MNMEQIPKVGDPRRPVALATAGAGRGARAMAPFIAEFNASSDSLALVPLYADPAPGRAVAEQRRALERGILAGAVELTGEALLNGTALPDDTVVIASVDRASGTAAIHAAAGRRRLTSVGYLVLRTPADELAGVRIVLRPEDTAAAAEATTLLTAVAANAPRVGSEAVFSSEGPAEFADLESDLRAGFADHLSRNISKVINNLEPATAPIEMQVRGVVHTVRVVAHPGGWATPVELAMSVRDTASNSPLIRGRNLVVAEVGPDSGLRLHLVRLRALDGRISVQGTIALDPATHARVIAEREEAIRRARRVEINSFNPIFTTD